MSSFIKDSFHMAQGEEGADQSGRGGGGMRWDLWGRVQEAFKNEEG